MMNDEHFVEVTVGSSFIVYRLFFVFCPVHVFHISAFSQFGMHSQSGLNGVRRYRFGRSSREASGFPAPAGSLRQHRRARNTEDVPAGEPLHGGRSGSADQAYRRVSGQVRPFGYRQFDGTSAETFHQRTLPYIKGEIRQNVGHAAHQSRSRRDVRFP